jgi:hypothetical protein
MAMTLKILPLLDECAANGALQSPVWMLGSQQFGGTRTDTMAWAARHGYPTLAANPIVASLFRDRYGIEEYTDFDFNGDAAVQLDLTSPLPSAYAKGAGSVIDLGTLEHVFDLRAAMTSAHGMLRPGGTFITVAPVTWWQHGFVNFNPRFFQAFAQANGYEREMEGFLVRTPKLPGIGVRVKAVVTYSDGQPRLRAKLWLDRLMNRFQPGLTEYCGCFRKVNDEPFVVPTDVFKNW